jgi:uncharacterized protein (DUF1800 family)
MLPRIVGLVCCGLSLSSAGGFGQTIDAVFADSFEDSFNFPANDAEAARFLNQATFAATAADIALVRSIGISTWLDQQLNSSNITLTRPWLEAYAASRPAGEGIQQNSQGERISRWFETAVNAPDQLRQRVAWALSQIIVVSDRNDSLTFEPMMMAEWSDLITRNAFGNYRALLQEATLSPMMGIYLSSFQNRKFELVPNGTAGTAGFFYSANNGGAQPDENFAREVMQLFSIGLLVRGNDFYSLTDDPGQPGVQPWNTYDERDISELARVFTGFNYRCTQGPAVVGGVTINNNCGTNGTACTGIACRFQDDSAQFGYVPPSDIVPQSRGLRHPDFYRPMVCYPRFHDNGRDTLGNALPDLANPPPLAQPLPAGSPTSNKTISLNGAASTLTIGASFEPASATPLNCNKSGNPPLTVAQMQACVDYCEGSVRNVVDHLFDHPNTAPMIARQLIQRLITSNPSAAYVQRIAAIFNNNGVGVRGDLKAVVKGIYTDIEARRPWNHPAQSAQFGKVREPMLKLVALWRHFGAVSGDTAMLPNFNPQGGAANPFAGTPSLRRWFGDFFDTNDWSQQRPYGAHSVFNFYEPDYRQPGPLALAGLYHPEFQIINEVSSITTANELSNQICQGYDSCSNGNALGGPGSLGAPTDRGYFPSAALDLIPSVMNNAAGAPPVAGPPTVADDIALIEFFNTRMLGGTMSGTLPATVTCPGNTGTGTKGLLMDALRCSGGINALSSGTRAERQRRKSLYLMHLIAAMPDYAVQR